MNYSNRNRKRGPWNWILRIDPWQVFENCIFAFMIASPVFVLIWIMLKLAAVLSY
jgi:hypothetical protein